MARRRYRRQVKPREVFVTLIILVALLAIREVSFVSQAVLAQCIVWFSAVAVLAAAIYYSFVYRGLIIRRNGLHQLQIDDVDTMSGIAFEDYVAELFRRQGYRIQNTAVSGDYGVDLVMIKDGVRIAVQTKRYSKPVNQAAVREVVAGMKHYKCTRAIVVTNNHFTRFAVDLARANDCMLVDREKLMEMIVAR